MSGSNEGGMDLLLAYPTVWLKLSAKVRWVKESGRIFMGSSFIPSKMRWMIEGGRWSSDCSNLYPSER